MRKDILIEDLMAMQEKTIIDIRSKKQYDAYHVPGAINIPEVGAILNASKHFDKNTPYYIICNMGSASIRVTEALMEEGYDVTNVVGGTNAFILMQD